MAQLSINGVHAHAQSVEFAYQRYLPFLPGVLFGARIDANRMYTKSKNYGMDSLRKELIPVISAELYL